MREKINISIDGSCLLLKIENVTDEDIRIVQSITGKVISAAISESGQNVTIDKSVYNALHSSYQEEHSSECESSDEKVLSCGKYAGKTIPQIMEIDAPYVLWMRRKNHTEFNWDTVLKHLDIWMRNCDSASVDTIKAIIRLLDLRPNVNSIESEICNSINLSSLDDIDDECDIEFMREIVVEYLTKLMEG